MGISQGLDSGATNSSTEEIRVIELSINNETHRTAAPVLMGVHFSFGPSLGLLQLFLHCPGKAGTPQRRNRNFPLAGVGDMEIKSSRSVLPAL